MILAPLVPKNTLWWHTESQAGTLGKAKFETQFSFSIKYTILKLQNRVLLLGQHDLCYPISHICVYLQAKPLHTSVAPESSNTVSDIHAFATHMIIYVRIEIRLTYGKLGSSPHLLFVVILLHAR